MEIIFKHGLRSVIADACTHLEVRVEGYDGHYILGGFIENQKLHPNPNLVKLISTGWRENIDKSWTYLAGEEYILGVLFNNKVYAVVSQLQPVVVV